MSFCVTLATTCKKRNVRSHIYLIHWENYELSSIFGKTNHCTWSWDSVDWKVWAMPHYFSTLRSASGSSESFVDAEKQTRKRFLKARELSKMWEENSINLRKTNIAHVPRSLERRSVCSLRRILRENLVALGAVICRIQCAMKRNALRRPQRNSVIYYIFTEKTVASSFLILIYITYSYDRVVLKICGELFYSLQKI